MKELSVCVIAISCFLSACALQQTTAQQGKTIRVDLPKDVQITEMNPNEPPVLFQYLLESNFVVIAFTNKSTAVGKRVKNPVPDMADWMVGTVNQFQIEELLFSRELFFSNDPLSMDTTRTFETFKKTGNWRETYKEDTRYLLFLKEIPKGDEIFATLELDKNKHYYRPYIGRQSIFPDPPDPMHGTYNVGRLDLSTGKYSRLIDSIKQLCEALSSGDNRERISNLQELAKSKDKVLRENAEYAIRFLSSKKEKSLN